MAKPKEHRAPVADPRKRALSLVPTASTAPTDNAAAASWQDSALCAQTDPEAFFPEKGGSTRDAKKVCRTCEVSGSCLDYALERDERFGIWGGLSEQERRKLTRAAA